MKFPHPSETIGVDKGLDPKPIEYVLTYDVPDIGDHVKATPKGSVVTDVSRSKYGGYDYTVKSTGIRQTTYYPWALAENTPENIKQLEVCWEAHKRRDEAQRIVRAESRKIKTLAIKE